MGQYDKPYSEEFEAFWRIYPRRASKRDAYRAWEQVEGTRPPVEVFERAIRTLMATEWASREKQHLPYPGTWLRANGWLDAAEIETEMSREAEDDNPYPEYPRGMALPIYRAMVELKREGKDPAVVKTARNPAELDQMFQAEAGHPFYATYFPHMFD